uniref:C2H2-type domain-containing protein n=1 Tax=Anopheles atroparvus TaxID=41427 RepID=A0AAG5CQZ8_ANOAO
MTLHNLATNVLIRALTLNLDSFPPGRKEIDQFTLDQLDTLLEKIKDFTKDAHLKPFEGNEKEKELALRCFLLQPNSVHCQFCHAFFTDYDKAIAHLTKHEQNRKQSVTNATVTNASFLDGDCIPRSTENLPKTVRKFLNTDVKVIMKKIRIETEFATGDATNSVLLRELEAIVRKKYPIARGYPFGSRFAGTASLNSDVDIFLDLKGKYNFSECRDVCNSYSPTDIKESIECVKQLILQETNDWLVDAVCFVARVPLLRLKSVKYDLKCDLTFSNGLSHRNSMWLWYIFYLQPSSRWLVCYLKQWNAEDCLNTYTMSLMVIFFFQCRYQLPSVNFLQRDNRRAKFIDGWNTDFARPTLKELGNELCDESISSLAQQFFTFYTTEFSLETDVVCPFLGRTGVKKHQFHEATNGKIPSEMVLLWHHLNQRKTESETKYPRFAYNRPFFVQDPFELNHNVAKGIPSGKASKYLRLMELSAKSLS